MNDTSFAFYLKIVVQAIDFRVVRNPVRYSNLFRWRPLSSLFEFLSSSIDCLAQALVDPWVKSSLDSTPYILATKRGSNSMVR